MIFYENLLFYATCGSQKGYPPKEEFIGAYVNCWVNGSTKATSLKKAKDYVDSEGWTTTHVEESYVAERERYVGDPVCIDSLECYDAACKYGVAGTFYTYVSEDAKEETEENNVSYQ